ncbi:MAG: hypothetical protein HOC70_08055 [Gammaproteobacteria bacterium]|nr:hypothetical protein [Gammaproteobacteria bacterium]MBT4493184.1 hypothetical protein [Gammaproteobacteria bacterium]MBT7372290.1 hypothetical protein [Gammaproteobacteria bacterium]
MPEIFKLKEIFGERLSFQLRCAGLQVGSLKPLTSEHIENLTTLWQSVAETTGQEFTFALPNDTNFIYHSELACRTLQIARQRFEIEPWQIFHDMQRAFYVDSRNLGDLDVLYELFRGTDLTRSEFTDLINNENIISTTRNEFSWCKTIGIQALPTLFLDLGEGPKLIAGGYATADFLTPAILERLTTH